MSAAISAGLLLCAVLLSGFDSVQNLRSAVLNFAATFPKATVLVVIPLIILAVYIFRVRFASPDETLKLKKSAQDKKRFRTYLAGYANGWYKLCDSSEIGIAGIKEVDALGHTLAVFRGQDGKIGVVDAHCPHMGANFTAGGKVVNNCIECPFHRWQFAADGKCKSIPYEDKVPDFAAVRSWQVSEQYQMVFVYYDAEGREAPYPLPHITGVSDGRMRYRGTYNASVRMHLQEFAENTVDYQHFDPLHGSLRLPFLGIPLPVIKVVHKTNWEGTSDESPHIASFTDDAHLKIFGKEYPNSGMHAHVTMCGPGGLTYFRFFIPKVGEILMFQTHTPVTPMKQRVQMTWYADPQIWRWLVHYVVGGWIGQWKADVTVWESKIYLANPMLTKKDGPVASLRRWYKQFYSDSAWLHKTQSDTACHADFDW
eukprot:TRINITY_DN10312_c0_g1_i2.p1 TRINITY_DN10312_c0_g1~~TRINITY_DN10312_c0_g1_i2.p1  ORF type:complete len:426 (+),score=55.61 TRINITY_DN10312_c0_g1_i2:1189-2466(+)